MNDAVSDGIKSPPIFVKNADGARLAGADGKEYIDFAGGIGATNSRHGNKEIITAIKKQADKFLHTNFSVAGYEGYIAVCEKLNRLINTGARNKSALFTTGAEAIENAVKIARKYTGREAVVSFEHAFHGRTLLALSLTSKIKPYKEGFGPFAPETYKLEYPYVYRRPARCQTDDEYVDYLLEHIENEFFCGVVDPENVAAVVMELVTGEGGFIVAPKHYVEGLAKICKKHGILLIIDEIQTGFARTGKMFAFEHYGIKPDLVTMAKSLSNGMPLSAVTGRAPIMDSVQEGGLGGTFAGNPVSCAAALEAIRFIEKNKLWLRAERIGQTVMKRFEEIRELYDCVGDVRGLGAMCAFEMVKNRKTKVPDEKTTKMIAAEALKRGLIVLHAGILGNDIRTLMPLTISDADLRRGLDILRQSVKAVHHGGKHLW
jgi:4-aminobutyrate aminotransferase/(S)-3-amino-2-methylpropionate transaminase